MKAKRWVIKLGTGIVSREDGTLDTDQFAQLAQQFLRLSRKGYQLVVVSSGAVGGGMQAMGLSKRPKDIAQLQACATVGQPRLMAEYQRFLEPLGMLPAQLLLTYWDLDSRSCYRNARHTLELLLQKRSFIPIINENDAISGEEIRVGDNDRLSAYVAEMIEAEKLIILSNVDGLLRTGRNGKQEVVPKVSAITDSLLALARGPGSERSVGGMITKIEAARIAGESGIVTYIANGRNPSVLLDIAAKKRCGTCFDLLPRPKKSSTIDHPHDR
jgi:glutamate 5-kinase